MASFLDDGTPRKRAPYGQELAEERFKDKKFLKLQKKWYEKLSRQKFKDIEIMDWETGEVRERTHGISQADVCNTWTPEQERYYQLAVHWILVMQHRRAKRRARRLRLPHVASHAQVVAWGMHADGKTYRAISERLRMPKTSVEHLVRKERELMLAFDWRTIDFAEGVSPVASDDRPTEAVTTIGGYRTQVLRSRRNSGGPCKHGRRY